MINHILVTGSAGFIGFHLCKRLYFLSLIEETLGKKTNIEYLPMQPGGVEATPADIDDLVRDHNYLPHVNVEEGVKLFIDWFKNYYGSGRSIPKM